MKKTLLKAADLLRHEASGYGDAHLDLRRVRNAEAKCDVLNARRKQAELLKTATALRALAA